jgi:hypothetical protein
LERLVEAKLYDMRYSPFIVCSLSAKFQARKMGVLQQSGALFTSTFGGGIRPRSVVGATRYGVTPVKTVAPHWFVKQAA